MGTHKPRSSKGGKRGRRSKIINDANKVIQKSYEEKNYELAGKVTAFSAFIESDKNQLSTELLAGILAYKNIVKNYWNVNIRKDAITNINASESISKIKLSSESRSNLNNIIIKNYNHYKKLRNGSEE